MAVAIPASHPLDRAAARSALGRYCSGVTVVTGQTDAGPRGFTLQAFHALSLDPLKVGVFVDGASTSWPRIAESGRFCVNVLAEDQAYLCMRFSRSGTDKFAGVDWWASAHGNPRLDGALLWADCRLEAEHPGGDHTIVVGDVEALDTGRPAPPLLFFRGTLGHVTADGRTP